MTGEDEDRGEGAGPASWTENDEQPLETERLDLAERDERLPWLESPDDDYEEERPGGSRILGLFALSIVALAAIVGGVWWASHRGAQNAAVADGSIIAAPKEPYKEAPKNPGGKTFEGTGDTSFAVSEGQTRPAKLAGGAPSSPSPAPAQAVAQAAAAPGKAGAAPVPAASANAGGVGVQIGAFSSRATAEAGWDKLVSQSHGALSGVAHRVVEGTADIGKVYRLQAVAADAAAAGALCGKLKSAGISCQVK